MNTKIITLIALFTPAQPFLAPRSLPYGYRNTLSPLKAEGGGTDWIKDAMDEEPKEPEFSKSEIEEMEELIVSLSKVSDDTKRREQLNSILEKELKLTTDPKVPPALSTEVPRFAKLFQCSLDNVGERVQTAAREKAMEMQEAQENTTTDNDNSGDDGEVVQRVKSEEELQLWALIDIMVQSKTAVKLHMGTIGSKGSFR